MRLLLKRRYTPRGSLGRLYLGSRFLCFLREPPKSCYSPEIHCVEEGVYELEPMHSEEHGWEIRVGEKGMIRFLPPDREPGHLEMGPATEMPHRGKALFARLAFQKLLEELGELWERGELVELQVIGLGISYKLSTCQIPKFS